MVKFTASIIETEDKLPVASPAVCYTGRELSDGRVCGKCIFHNNGYEMDIDSVEAEDDEIAEGLIRSALNYCANRGTYIAHYLAPGFGRVAEMLGFADDDGTPSGEIPELLRGSCCK
ncbi:MAG: hypothetical protein IJT03_06190 [Clostridia bacterium]|nr:hypothetical protein [Clostridia bacterium]